MPGFCLSTASRQGPGRVRGSRASAVSWLAYAVLLGLRPAATPTAAELSVVIYTGTKGTVKKLTREQRLHPRGRGAGEHCRELLSAGPIPFHAALVGAPAL